jgi:DNA-binding response OmpR family regulator
MKVLIIDDMSFARDLVRQNLKNLGVNCDITEASNLHSAYNQLQDSLRNREPFDLVVTDLLLPDGSAIEIIKKIRATKSYKTLPIILMTSEDKREKIVEAISIGTTDYCFKPVDPLDLFDKIKRFIN